LSQADPDCIDAELFQNVIPTLSHNDHICYASNYADQLQGVQPVVEQTHVLSKLFF
jgi:hypothetical protein